MRNLWQRLRLPGPSIRWRMTLASMLLLLAFTLLTAAALEKAFRSHAEATRQERLQAVAYLLMAATELDSNGKILLPEQLTESSLMLPASGLYAQIISARSLWQSPSSLGQPVTFVSSLPSGKRYFSAIDENGQRYFSFAMGVTWPTDKGPVPLTFSVSEDAKPFDLQIQQYQHTLWRWLAGCAALLLLLQVLLLRWGLQPLQRLATSLQAIENGDKDTLEGSYPQEIQPLTDNLNALIHSERARQQRYQHALDDLAHSLKTPIAVIRSTDAADPHFPATVQEQTSRIETLIGYQLQRAATRGAMPLSRQTPLAPTITRLISTLEKVHRDKNLTFENQIPATLKARISDGDAMELFGNLLDNAAKWAAHTVRIRPLLTTGSLSILVEDDGPGVADPAAVLQRGVRLDESVPGHGIGLSIVSDIVASYDGTITVGQAPGLGGACFEIRFPQAGH